MIPASRSKLVGIGVFNFISCILIHLQQGSKSLDPSESGQNPTCSTCFCFRGHLHMFKHVHVALCQVIGRPSIFLEPYDDWTPNHNFPMVCFSCFFPCLFPTKTWSILKPSPGAPSKRLQRRAVPHFAALQSEDPAIAQLLSGTSEIPKQFEKW